MKLTLTGSAVAYLASMYGALFFVESAAASESLLLQNNGAPTFEEQWVDLPVRRSAKYDHKEKLRYAPLDHTSRPVIGVLTEPIRGNLY